ncbi:MAG: hypothetical protein ACNA7W_04825 [Pseudomonadales bacterium]
MTKQRLPGSTSGILGDLESIRTLLEENQQSAPEQPAETDEEQVPLLEDVVDGGVSVNESFLSGAGDFQRGNDQHDSSTSQLNDEMFKTLLSDDWRQSARELLDDARGAIEARQIEWTPEHTDELNAALKVRIDETLQSWLQAAVLNGIDDLRRELLDAVREQLSQSITAQFNDTSPDEDLDGA